MNVHFKSAILSLVGVALLSVSAVAAKHDAATDLSTATSGSGKEQLKAIDRLGMMHENPSVVVPKLRELLKNADPQVRYRSARSLGEFGELAHESAAELVGLLKDQDPVVQYHAAIALGKVDDKSDATVSALVGAATSKDPRVARASIAALRNLKPGPGTGGPASYVPVYAAMLMPPVVPVHLPNGDYGQNNVLPYIQYGFSEPGIHNPLAVLELYENKQNYSGLLSNIFLQWEPIKGLQFKSQGGVTAGATTYSEYTPSTLAYASAPFANLSNPQLTGLASQVSIHEIPGKREFIHGVGGISVVSTHISMTGELKKVIRADKKKSSRGKNPR